MTNLSTGEIISQMFKKELVTISENWDDYPNYDILAILKDEKDYYFVNTVGCSCCYSPTELYDDDLIKLTLDNLSKFTEAYSLNTGCKIYSLIPLGFEVLEGFEEENKDKEANKDLESGLSLTVCVNEDNIFVLHVLTPTTIPELENPVYHYSEPYNFSTIEELKTWMENVLPTLEVEFVN
jgi:hypothetical protein